MKLSDHHISTRGHVHDVPQWCRGIQHYDSSRAAKNEEHILLRPYTAPFDRNLLSAGRVAYERRAMLHFNNVLIRNTEAVQECLASFGFIRIK
jgi:hypothetical protein